MTFLTTKKAVKNNMSQIVYDRFQIVVGIDP